MNRSLGEIQALKEIDAGDTFAYDAKGQEDKFARESKSAKRLFGWQRSKRMR